MQNRRDPAANVQHTTPFIDQRPNAIELPEFAPVAHQYVRILPKSPRPRLLEQQFGVVFVDDPEKNRLHEAVFDETVSDARRHVTAQPFHNFCDRARHRGIIAAVRLDGARRRSYPPAASKLMPRKLSIVAPVYNEGELVVRFLEELTAVLQPLPYEIEVIAVDDGSSDETPRILDELCAKYPQLGVVHLSRNFGHQAALTAGLDAATGDAIIMMDSDLEHPPALIPRHEQRPSYG